MQLSCAPGGQGLLPAAADKDRIGAQRCVNGRNQAVSLWLRRKDADGRVHLISTDVVTLGCALAPLIVGVLLALLLPWVQWLRSWIQGN